MNRLGDTRRIDQFNDEYTLVDVDYEIESVCESVGIENTEDSLFVLIGDAEYLEVWRYDGFVPYLSKVAECVYTITDHGIVSDSVDWCASQGYLPLFYGMAHCDAGYTAHNGKVLARGFAMFWDNPMYTASEPKTQHYIAMAGLRGYLPNFADLYTDSDYADIVDSLIDMHEPFGDEIEALTTEQYDAMIAAIREELTATGYVSFDRTIDLPDGDFISIPWHAFGNEYAEITECDCDNPCEHSDNPFACNED